MYPQNIIIHHSLTKDSGTVSWVPIRKYHTETLGWLDIGYHFGIERVDNSYEILMGRMPNVIGAHTKGMNQNSIGICLVGNFDTAPPSKEQWDKLIQLCLYLMSVYNISVNNIYGHRDFASYKSCPGKMFDIEKLKKDLVKIN